MKVGNGHNAVYACLFPATNATEYTASQIIDGWYQYKNKCPYYYSNNNKES